MFMSHHHNHHHDHAHCESCSHEHHHHHHEEEGGGLRRQLLLIAATAVLLSAAIWVEKHCALPTWQLLMVYLVPYLLIGHSTLREAAEGLAHGDAFNEHFLMTIATIGALAIGFLPGAETEFPEAVFVMLFFQVGELFEGYAEGQSRKSISHLMAIRPDIAHVERAADERPKTIDYRLQAVDDRLQTIDCRLQTLDDRLQTLDDRLQTVDDRLQTVDFRLQTVDDSVKTTDFRLQTVDVSPEEVAVGETIVVRPGEKVPLDGIIIEGNTALDTVALTGESLPRSATTGDEVLSGSINLSGVIRVRTTKTFSQSTVATIIELVEHAADHKSRSETFITRFARVYTPVVVFAALALAIIPPLCMAVANSSFSILQSSFPTWLYRALLFLVVSCPCALVISVPLTFFGAIGGASRRGILVKGATFLDLLAHVDTVVFDKTGTLTHGSFAVSAVHPDQVDERHLLHLAAHVERFSSHPIAAALRQAFPDEATDGCSVSDVQEMAGQGVSALVTLPSSPRPHRVCVGNTKLMETVGAHWHHCLADVGTVIHVAIDGQYAGHIVIADEVKADSADAIARLHRLGVSRTVMLTGDREEVAAQVASQVGIDEYHAELLPQDKVAHVDALATGCLAFVGDGLNDAPVLARADVGIAMGGLGSQAAIEAADVVIMDDHPSRLPTAIAIARRAIAIARQNIVLAIGIKVAVLILAALGLATMWMAVFADVGVTVLAVLNAMRTLKSQGEARLPRNASSSRREVHGRAQSHEMMA